MTDSALIWSHFNCESALMNILGVELFVEHVADNWCHGRCKRMGCRKNHSPCMTAVSWKERKRSVDFFLTPSASILKMPAIKVMVGKDERQKELVTNHSLLPLPQKWGSPNPSCSAVVPHYALLQKEQPWWRLLNHRALAQEDESVTMATTDALKSVHIQNLSPVSYCISKWLQREVVAEAEEYSRMFSTTKYTKVMRLGFF